MFLFNTRHFIPLNHYMFFLFYFHYMFIQSHQFIDEFMTVNELVSYEFFSVSYFDVISQVSVHSLIHSLIQLLLRLHLPASPSDTVHWPTASSQLRPHSGSSQRLVPGGGAVRVRTPCVSVWVSGRTDRGAAGSLDCCHPLNTTQAVRSSWRP